MLEELLKQRYSVRDYSDKPIEDEVLTAILEAGRLAPTAKNLQPQKIFVLKSENALAKIRSVTRCAFNAPIVLMVCGDADVGWNNPFSGENYNMMDVSIVTTQMMLRAAELGVGSCWVCLFDPQVVSQVFNLSDNLKPRCLLTLGYPSDKAAPSERHSLRKSLEDTVTVL